MKTEKKRWYVKSKREKKWFNQNASLFIYNIEFSTKRTTNDFVDDGNDGRSK